MKGPGIATRLQVSVDAEGQFGGSYACRWGRSQRVAEMLWYREEQRMFAGNALYRLVPESDSFKLRFKRVDLINAEAWHKSIPIYL